MVIWCSLLFLLNGELHGSSVEREEEGKKEGGGAIQVHLLLISGLECQPSRLSIALLARAGNRASPKCESTEMSGSG